MVVHRHKVSTQILENPTVQSFPTFPCKIQSDSNSYCCKRHSRLNRCNPSLGDPSVVCKRWNLQSKLEVPMEHLLTKMVRLYMSCAVCFCTYVLDFGWCLVVHSIPPLSGQPKICANSTSLLILFKNRNCTYFHAHILTFRCHPTRHRVTLH